MCYVSVPRRQPTGKHTARFFFHEFFKKNFYSVPLDLRRAGRKIMHRNWRSYANVLHDVVTPERKEWDDLDGILQHNSLLEEYALPNNDPFRHSQAGRNGMNERQTISGFFFKMRNTFRAEPNWAAR